MKLLSIVSTVDLSYRYGCTPAWWQLFKGLYEIGNEIIVTPYQGYAIESLWWRSYPNPCEKEAWMFTKIKNFKQKYLKIDKKGGTKSKGASFLIDKIIKPKWKRHIIGILSKEGDIDAVLVMGVPINHLTGLLRAVKKEFDIPFFFYDCDIPASLPSYGGFATGFNIYTGADLSEYDGFIINSKGGIDELKEMGAENVHTLQFGADPSVYKPVKVDKQDIDVFFYGWGYEYRSDWMECMMKIPSKKLNGVKIALGGGAFDLNLGNVELLGDVPFSAWRRLCCRSKINLNITRSTHANLYATSTSRPFELASLSSCIVSNPYNGLEEWFEPKKEIFIATNEEEVIELYNWLLDSEEDRLRAGELARKRVLMEHTFQHRAHELFKILQKVSK